MKMDDSKLDQEDKILNDTFQVNIDELKRMADFFKSFVENFQKICTYEDKDKKQNVSVVYQSILLSGLAGIYDSFIICVKNIKNIMSKIQNGLIQPLDEFRFEQLKIYKNDLNKIKEINKEYKKQSFLLEKAKNNYYKAAFELRKKYNNKNMNYNYKNEEVDNSLALYIKSKMLVKNYEIIYKYE